MPAEFDELRRTKSDQLEAKPDEDKMGGEVTEHEILWRCGRPPNSMRREMIKQIFGVCLVSIMREHHRD
jgi:hypothetical protein